MNRLGTIPEFEGLEDPDSTIRYLPSYTAEDQRRHSMRIGELQAQEAQAQARDSPSEFIRNKTPLGDISASLITGTQSVSDAVSGGLSFINEDLGNSYDDFIDLAQSKVKQVTGVSPYTQEEVDSYRSDATTAQRKEIEEAEGFVDTVAAGITNPLGTLSHITDSGVPIAGIGLMTKGLKALGVGSALAAGTAEGTFMGGSQAYEINKNKGGLNNKDRALVAATSIIGGATGVLGGKFSNKMGAVNPEEIFSGKISNIVDNVGVATLKSGAIEAAEEMIQSTVETITLNAALGKPLTEGVSKAAGMGFITGGGMGLGTGFMFSDKAKVLDPATGEELQNSKVEKAASKINNLERLKETQEDNKVSQTVIDETTAKINSVKDNLKNSKTEEPSDFNDEVDSILDYHDKKSKDQEVIKILKEHYKPIETLSQMFEAKGFTREEANVLVGNAMEKYGYTKDQKSFLQQIDKVVDLETEDAKRIGPDYFKSYSREEVKEQSTQEVKEPDYIKSQEDLDNGLEIDRNSLDDLQEDPIVSTELNDRIIDDATESRVGEFYPGDAENLSSDVLSRYETNTLTPEETESIAAQRAELEKATVEVVQEAIHSEDPVVSKVASEVASNIKTANRLGTIANTTTAINNSQVDKKVLKKDKNIYSTLKTNKAKASYHQTHPEGVGKLYRDAVTNLREVAPELEEATLSGDSILSIANPIAGDVINNINTSKSVSKKHLEKAIEDAVHYTSVINNYITKIQEGQSTPQAVVSVTEETNEIEVVEEAPVLTPTPEVIDTEAAEIAQDLSNTYDALTLSELSSMKDVPKDITTLASMLFGESVTDGTKEESTTLRQAKDNKIAKLNKHLEKVESNYDDPNIDVNKIVEAVLRIESRIEALKSTTAITTITETKQTIEETDSNLKDMNLSNEDLNSLSDDVDYSLTGIAGTSKIKGVLPGRTEAMRLTRQGVSPLEVFNTTGWFYDNSEAKWLFEVDDSIMIAKRDTVGTRAYDLLQGGESTTLESIIGHETLFKMYPELKSLKVMKDHGMVGNGSFMPMSPTSQPLLKLRNGILNHSTLDTLIHEIQHYIQSVEGFNMGGNTTMFSRESIDEYINKNYNSLSSTVSILTTAQDIKLGLTFNNDILSASASKVAERFPDIETLGASLAYNTTQLKYISEIRDNLNSDKATVSDKEYNTAAYTMYHNLIGEVAARDTAYRRLMTEEQRSNLIPLTSEQILSGLKVSNKDNNISFDLDTDTSSKEENTETNKIAFDHIDKRLDYSRLNLVTDAGDSLPFSMKFVKDKSDLPSHIQPEGFGVKGAYDRKTNTVYIVDSSHKDSRSIVTTIAHEVIGHVGLRKVLGSNVDNLYHRMITSDKGLLKDIFNNVPHYKLYMDQWLKSNDLASQERGTIYRTVIDGKETLVPKAVAMRLADEYMANLAGKEVFFTKFIKDNVGKSKSIRNAKRNKRSKLLHSFLVKIQHQLRKVFGKHSEDLSNTDLMNILAESVDHVFKRTDFDYRQLVTKQELTNMDIAAQGSFLAHEAAERLKMDRDLINKSTAIMIKGGFGKLNQSWHEKRADDMGRVIKKHKFTAPFFALGNLNYDKHLGVIESRASGSMLAMNQFSQEFHKATRNLDSKAMSELMLYFTTANSVLPETALTSDKVLEAKLRQIIPEAKTIITSLGEDLVGLGLLDSETYLENRSSYLPNRYVKYLVTYKGSKAKPSFQDYLKRKDPDLSKIDQERLGLIKDPSFLVSEAIGVMSRDITLNQMYNTIYETSRDNNFKWILGEDEKVKDHSGKRMSVVTLRSQIEHQQDLLKIHEDAEVSKALNYSETTYKTIQNDLDNNLRLLEEYNSRVKTDVAGMLAKQGEDITPTSEEISSFLNANYKQMPESKRYGSLAGQYVRKEIFNSFFEIDSIHNEINDLAVNGTLVKTNALFKWLKVAMNPTSHARNMFSNITNLDMSTNTNPIAITAMLWDTLGSVANKEEGDKDRFYQMALKGGLAGTTMSAQELQHLSTNYSDRLKRKEAKNPAYAGLYLFNESFHDLVDVTSKVFRIEETLFKTVSLRDYIQTWEAQKLPKGETIDSLDKYEREAVISEAIAHANKSLLDYSKVPKAVSFMRKVPLGAPFLTYTYKMFPVLIENAAKRPHKLAPYLMIPGILTMLAASGEGWDDEDLEKFKRDLPNYNRDSSASFIVPWKIDGKLQILDLDWVLAYAPYFNAALKATNHSNFSTVTDSLASTANIAKDVTTETFGFLGGPIPSWINALQSNENTFTHRNIMTEGAPADQRRNEFMQYMWDSMMPPWATSSGVFAKLYKEGYGYKTYNLKEEQYNFSQTALSFAGLTHRNADPVEGKRYNAFDYARSLKNAKKAYRAAVHEGTRKGISHEEQATLKRNFVETIKRLKTKL